MMFGDVDSMRPSERWAAAMADRLGEVEWLVAAYGRRLTRRR